MFNNLWLLWEAALVSIGFYAPPKIITYGPLPQKIEVYDHKVGFTDYRSGPLTLNENDFSYVRGEKKFHNPSNYGIIASPDVPGGPWENRRQHLAENCNQSGPISDRQQRALDLIFKEATPLPNGGVTWRYDYALDYKNIVYLPGWNSAFSQSVNIAALLFAECKTKDKKYLDLASKAALGLITPISKGGLLNDDDGLTFFEEYPAAKGFSPYTLNAHILSLNVLYAMAAASNDAKFKHFADLGTETLVKLAPQFSEPTCIKYRLKDTDRACHPDYDAYESLLLDDLHKWTNDDRIQKLADQWKKRAAGPYPKKLRY